MAKRIVSVRMSVDEYAAIEQRAKAAGQSVSEWMRQAAKIHYTPAPFQYVSGYPNNTVDWNRLTTCANPIPSNGIPSWQDRAVTWGLR